MMLHFRLRRTLLHTRLLSYEALSDNSRTGNYRITTINMREIDPFQKKNFIVPSQQKQSVHAKSLGWWNLGKSSKKT